MTPIRTRAVRLLVAFDVFLFALLTLGDARRNETISAAAWSLETDGKFLGKVLRPLIDFLARPFERNHCQTTWAYEQATYATTHQ